MRTKKCPDCKTVKPIKDFGRNRQSPDGLHYYCRECAAERQRQWTASNPGKVKTMRQAYLTKVRTRNDARDPYAD
jgi:hypothetical protein